MKSRPKTPAPIKALRCATGKSILKAWAKSINDLSHQMHGEYPFSLDGQWQKTFVNGYLKYVRHATKCPSCGAFEQMRLARYK